MQNKQWLKNQMNEENPKDNNFEEDFWDQKRYIFKENWMSTFCPFSVSMKFVEFDVNIN